MGATGSMVEGKFAINAHRVATVRISIPKAIRDDDGEPMFTVRDVTFEMVDGSTLSVTAFSDEMNPVNVVYEPAELTDADRAVATQTEVRA